MARRRWFRSAAGVLTLTLLAACTGLTGPNAGEETQVRAAPALADVAVAADPRSVEGPSTAVVPELPIVPVTGPEPQLPAQVVDHQGTTVVVEDGSRILALDLAGSLARTVFELGLGAQVVGRDTSTGFPEAADLPLVTENGHELNAEAILALEPTVILTDTTLGPWDVMEQVRSAGVPVVVLDSHRGIDTVGELTTSVAAALGVPARGAALAERTEREVAAVRAQIDAVAPGAVQDQLRMVFLYVRGQAGVYYMFGEGSGADSLIEAIGGHDASAEIDWSGMKPVTDEAVIAAQPDLILMMTKGLESVDGVDGLLEKLPALANTPAGQHRRIVDMSDTQVLSFGPRTAQVLNALAVAVYAPESVS